MLFLSPRHQHCWGTPDKTSKTQKKPFRDKFSSRTAVATLQEGAEAYLVTVLYQSNLLAIHSNRETLMAKDIELQQVLMADNGFKNTYTGTAKTT